MNMLENKDAANGPLRLPKQIEMIVIPRDAGTQNKHRTH
jgi:hypothetical protein